MKNKPEIAVGGQAVIEGVMMRGPQHIATALRKKDGHIVLKKQKFVSKTKTNKFFGLPLIRGFVSLIEMLSIGIKTLNFSAEEAIKDEEADKPGKKKNVFLDKLYTAFSYIFAFGLAFLLFVFLPYRIAYWINIEKTSILFNLFAGGIRIIFFVVYVYLISLLKDVHRLFQYHGAEHKSVFAYEGNPDFTLEDTKQYRTYHPRCGTSFMLIVLVIAILVFSIFDTILALILGHAIPLGIRIVLHLLLLPFVSGISYEILRFSGKNINHWLVKAFSAPGLALQRITTQEPDSQQLEVAICALHAALDLPLTYPDVEILTDDESSE
ncbi:MAG: DUF1385 domain-containing protein [Candidatus Celaenobacter antarcticus]|nr:DUF1385 domain-containing protein [Candidatus Celaenobacter antarcticus]MDP8315571.1 DUF1385 domain-containing protein [Candidatus Celaenobacter antarcticus]